MTPGDTQQQTSIGPAETAYEIGKAIGLILFIDGPPDFTCTRRQLDQLLRDIRRSLIGLISSECPDYLPPAHRVVPPPTPEPPP